MESATHDHAVDLETAIDFVNTFGLRRGHSFDDFGTTAEAFDWLQGHGLVHGPTGPGGEGVLPFGPGSSSAGPEAAAPDRPGSADRRTDADAPLRRIRRARAALRELADAAFEHRPPAADMIAEVNRALRSREVLQLVPDGDGIRLGHRHVGDPVDDALARLAEPIVREIAAGRADRIRACADDGCRWVFYDDSRTGRRRWCDMASCGNRAKAARHRARLRTEPSEPPVA